MKNNSEFWDNRIAWATAFYFIGSVMNATLKTIFPFAEAMGGALSALFGLAILVGFLQCLKEVLHRKKTLFVGSFIVFFVVYFISAILIAMRGEPLDVMLRHSALITFAWWIPCGVYAASINDKRILYDVWVKASYVISICCILIYFFHVPTNDTGANEYNMTFGSQITLPLLIQINELYRKRRLWLLGLVLFEVFLLIVYGNRGVLLSIVFFVIYKFAFESDSILRKIFSFFILGLFAFLLLSNIETIAVTAVNILDKFDFQSRTLDLLASGAISDTSGRDELWKISYEMIEKHPILGWGLGGENYYIALKFMGTTDLDDLYAYNPHNAIVQNLVNFGVFFGTLITLLFIYPFFCLKRIKDRYLYSLILIFGSATVIPMLVSAAGLFVKPAVAMFFYLFYYRTRSYKKARLINHSESLSQE